MKKDIFNKYAQTVANIFGITPEDIFTKTKERTCVDARHLLYFVCKNRPMRITYIQQYMNDNGYNINHSSIIHGINQVQEKINEDRDYVGVIKKVEKCIV
jgi:chromosomal replication initiation ATPase DnaA|tara:strand:- start:1009 stop:1308 length:300 start_codon:yes stop_codon:yes gene_type:complete